MDLINRKQMNTWSDSQVNKQVEECTGCGNVYNSFVVTFPSSLDKSMEIGEVEDEGRIVPQLKIGADGSIQLDEARYMYMYIIFTI